MTPRFQKLGLLAHITFSVGWFGAILPYLALAIAALTSHDEQTVRGACLSMYFVGWFVIVPLSLAATLSGIVQALVTRWGVIRYWWVLAKLVLTVFAVVILFQHMRDVSRLALMARETTVSGADLPPEVLHSAGGLLVLFVAMTLSVFKPGDMTPYGRRRASQVTVPSQPRRRVPAHEPVFATAKPRWARIIGFHALAIVMALMVAHLVIFHLSGHHH